MNFEQVARNYLISDKKLLARLDPPGVAMSLEWRNGYYVGSVQQIELDYSPEIVLLNKNSNPQELEFHEAILKLDPERLQLTADDTLNLEGRLHIVRKVGDTIKKLTDEQTRYMEGRPVVMEDQTGHINIIRYMPS